MVNLPGYMLTDTQGQQYPATITGSSWHSDPSGTQMALISLESDRSILKFLLANQKGPLQLEPAYETTFGAIYYLEVYTFLGSVDETVTMDEPGSSQAGTVTIEALPTRLCRLM
ncbi:MAG: hypothetical protein H7Y37_05775 [Anaerolineae bacterium]|nr:hypothetical protein [Gloeobacterales cyanobacterium ES-bin-313]